jgi:hypothetical protein
VLSGGSIVADVQLSIFISYSRTDSAFVDRLEADLRARDFQTWVDRRRLEGGQDWADSIQRALERCEVMLVILSPDSIASEWVKKELSFAQTAGKRIIPVHFRAVSQVPLRLEGLQWVEFSGEYQAGLDALLFALAAPVPAPSPRPMTPQVPLSDTQPDVGPDLVEVRPGPTPPDPNLNELYKAAFDARANRDLERAAVYLQQVVERDKTFGDGLAASDLEAVQAQLRPVRMQRLREQALAASREEDWRAATGAWQALLGVDPTNGEAQRGIQSALRSRAEKAYREGAWGEEIGAWEALLKITPDDSQAQERIPVAEQNQQWEWIYGNAQDFVRDRKLVTAREALETLWGKPPAYDDGKAPYYGDPAGIAPVIGIAVPLSYEEAKRQAKAKAEAEAKAKAEAEAKAKAEAEAARQQAAVEAAERERQATITWEGGNRRRVVRGWQDTSNHWHGLRSNPITVWLWALFLLAGVGTTVGLFAGSSGASALPQGVVGSVASVVFVGLIIYGLAYRRLLAPVPFALAVLPAMALSSAAVWFGSIVSWSSQVTARLFFASDGHHFTVQTVLTYGLIYVLGLGFAIGGFSNADEDRTDAGFGWAAFGFFVGMLSIIFASVILVLAAGGGWAIVLGIVFAIVWFICVAIVAVAAAAGPVTAGGDNPTGTLLAIIVVALLQALVVYLAGSAWFGVPLVAIGPLVAALLAGGGIGAAITMGIARDAGKQGEVKQ